MKKLTTVEKELLTAYHASEQKKSRNRAKAKRRRVYTVGKPAAIPLTENDLASVHPMTALYWSNADAESRRQTAARLPNYPTDTAIAVMRKWAGVFAYTAVKTNFQKSGHPAMWELLKEGEKYLAVYPDWQKHEYAAAAQLLDESGESALQEVKVQKKYRRRITAKRSIWQACRRKTLKFTDTGKAYLSVKMDNPSNKFADLAQTAFLALWERADTMHCLDDIAAHSIFAYRAINAAIHAERRAWNESRRQTAAESDGQTESQTTAEFDRVAIIDRRLVDLMDDDQTAAVVDYIRRHCRKDTAERTAQIVARHIGNSYTVPMTTREIAAALEVNHKVVDRALCRARDLMTTAAAAAFVRSLFG